MPELVAIRKARMRASPFAFLRGAPAVMAPTWPPPRSPGSPCKACGDGTGDGAAHSYVRQLWDMKGSMHLETMTGADLVEYGRLCGWVLARAHARSDHAAFVAAGEGLTAPGPGRSAGTNQRKGAEG